MTPSEAASEVSMIILGTIVFLLIVWVVSKELMQRQVQSEKQTDQVKDVVKQNSMKITYKGGDGWYFVGDEGGSIYRIVMWQILETLDSDEGPKIKGLVAIHNKGIPRIVPAPGGGLYKHKDELTDGELRQAARG